MKILIIFVNFAIKLKISNFSFNDISSQKLKYIFSTNSDNHIDVLIYFLVDHSLF
jgi:hypothetical protein